uniref:Uncharacterized protein n=1 Tax=Steinernema glaseri TaxID=37863 RepID=A0A1I7ZBX5_9BILA
MNQLVFLVLLVTVCSVFSEPFVPSAGFYIPVSYDRFSDGSLKNQMKRKDAFSRNTESQPPEERLSMFDMSKRDFALQRQQLKRMKPCFYSPIQCLMKRAP